MMSDTPKTSVAAANVLALCRTVAARHARRFAFKSVDLEDFAQEFVCHVAASVQFPAILALPHKEMLLLLETMARKDCLDFARSLSRRAVHEAESLCRT